MATIFLALDVLNINRYATGIPCKLCQVIDLNTSFPCTIELRK